MTIYVHETAIIDDGAKIGNNSRIWHWSHICGGAVLGEKVSIGQNVYIGSDVRIGSNCKIQNNISIYDAVYLEDGVFCGPSMVFTNVHNPRAFVDRKSEYRPTNVRVGATLGANCTIVCGVEIGAYAFIGAGTVVTCDIPAFGLFVGNPGKQIGWMSKHGSRLDLPVEGFSSAFCEVTGDLYRLNKNLVTLEQQDD